MQVAAELFTIFFNVYELFCEIHVRLRSYYDSFQSQRRLLYRIIFKVSGTEPDFYHMTKPMKGRKTRDVNTFVTFNMGPKFKKRLQIKRLSFPYSCNNNEVVLISRIMKIEFEMIVYKINAKTENIKAVSCATAPV